MRRMMTFTAVLSSLEDTRAMGACLARYLPSGAVCLLRGDLAAGKTTLVKAVCAQYGIAPQAVTSPTYTIANWYEGDVVVCHVDFYRLESPDDLYNLDDGDWLNPDGPTFIEWPDVALNFLKGVDTLEISLGNVEGDTAARRVTVSARGESYGALFSGLGALAEARGLAVLIPGSDESAHTPC